MNEPTKGASSSHDVVIVGLGPVGAFAALQLAESGLRVAVVERSPEHVILPRAVGIDGEALRACQRIGIGDTVDAIVQPPRERDEVCFTDSRHDRLFGLEIPKLGFHGWRDIAFFDQPELEALLRDLVARNDRIDVFLGEEVVALDQDDDEVVLECEGAGGSRSLRAAYAIGCDGAASFVRRAVGIDWLSLGYDQDWLVIDILQKPEADLPLATMQVCDPERLTTYVCVKDPNRRWEFQLLPGETREQMLRPEKIRELLDPWLPPEHYDLRRAAVYQFHAATAARWQVGRVFLAGDAAHQTPPFLGQGLNAGFRDAVNLGWKLPLVLAGACDPRLLESYAEERDAHARDLVEWAVAVGKLMETLAAQEAGRPNPHPNVDHSAGYGQGRTAPPLRGGVLVDAQVRDDGAVGNLMRQPSVRTPGGSTVRLDELLGKGFAVVGRKPGDLQMGAEAAAVVERLGARTLSLSDLELAEGSLDSLFDSHPAVVLRPDRYVFGVVDDAWSLDRLLGQLASRLALR
ncbi:MAG: bifunctional 3-(3-hydroxy-phenyl)propionate/3-hydroxycinnamic acid hydroxylase [Myxococcota bacterium]